jgi:hypothetical protein
MPLASLITWLHGFNGRSILQTTRKDIKRGKGTSEKGFKLGFFGNQKKWQHFSTRKNKVSYLLYSHCVRCKLLKRFLASSLFATICKLAEVCCTSYTWMLGMQRSKPSADQKRKQRPYTLILFNQNIVWGFLTKFGTKIDSYKMDVYATKLKHIQIKETDLQIKSSRKQASRF